MSDHAAWLTLRELDRRAGAGKGCAFRAFKRIRDQLQEDRDYRLLEHARDSMQIAELRQGGRIYATSINVLLIHPKRVDLLLDELAAGGPDGRRAELERDRP